MSPRPAHPAAVIFLMMTPDTENMQSRDEGSTAGPPAASAGEKGGKPASDAAAAETRARNVLKSQPQNPDALLLLASALRQQDRALEAKAILEPIVASQPDSVFAQLELGLTLDLVGEQRSALAALARAVDLAPTFANAWCAIATIWVRSEQDDEARGAVKEAAAAIQKGDFPEAETKLERFLERCPDCQPAGLCYAVALLAQEKAHAATAVADGLLRRDPRNMLFAELRASALCEVGEFGQAIAQYQAILADGRDRPGAWISYGRALRAIGRGDESVGAFRKAVEILPAFAAGHRTLATVKTVTFDVATVQQLRGLLARPGLVVSHRAQLHFALAKALEDTGQYAEAFENYRRSNELQATGASGTADRFLDLVRRTKGVFTQEYFRQRAGTGSQTRGPIFIVGMLRAGSTLVQEILAAHSAVERTGELRDLNRMAMGLHADRLGQGGSRRYPEALGLMDRGRFLELGEEYLERTRSRRKLGRPLFIDKLPENFLYAGLIHLILPNAAIIDVRRHPLDCCLSCFRNYFPEGPKWTHDLGDLGRYYAGYVELMAHFDAVLPGRIHRIIYEKLIADPEGEVRRLLGHLGLPFEKECLRYYAKEQAILTTSVEQAMRPIYEDAVGNSRNYEPWLGPLKNALGAVLNAYPAVPTFYPQLRASFTMRLA